MQYSTELPTLTFESKKKFADWLAKNYDKSAGLWLKIAKKATGIPTVTYAEALDVALCYGWIDGQKGSFDDQYFLQKFTPRRPKSIWSKVNVGHVERLIASGGDEAVRVEGGRSGEAGWALGCGVFVAEEY